MNKVQVIKCRTLDMMVLVTKQLLIEGVEFDAEQTGAEGWTITLL